MNKNRTYVKLGGKHPLFPGLKQTTKARLWMAEHLGRSLLSNELVHHIDEDFTNDDPENLELIIRKDHIRRHHIGKKRTAEARAKMSKSHKNKQLTLEHKRKISLAFKGRIPSEETRLKMSKAQKGRTFTKESLLKIKIARQRQIFTEETRKKISEAGKGRIQSEETRKKRSESISRWWENRKKNGK